MIAGEPAVSLRPARDNDRAFLARVYASTRAEELAAVPWSDEQRRAFLEQQFEAQSVHYAAHYGDASFDVVVVDGEAAGRLIVARREDELKVIDLALLPEHRGHGIGTRLMQALIDEAAQRGVTITIYVERFNRALRLHERLGFVAVHDAGVYLKLQQRPPSNPAGKALEFGASRSPATIAAERGRHDGDRYSR